MSYYTDDADGWFTPGRVLALLCAALLGIYGIGWIVTAGDFWMYKFWAPKQANVERQVFENTQSYVDGKITYLDQLQREYYANQDPDYRRILRDVIVREADMIDANKLPVDLRAFVEDVKGAHQ